MTEKKKQKPKKAQALEIYVGEDKMALAQNVATQVKMLSLPTPQKYIMQRKGRGNLLLDYVETNYVIGLLNAIFKFDWDCEIIEQIVDKDEGQIAMKVRLTVRFADGKLVTKTAWGGSDIKRIKGDTRMVDFADDLKSAESDGIKKAASMLGICWDVYSGLTPSGKKKDKRAGVTNGLTDAPTGPPERQSEFRNIAIKVGSKTVIHTRYEALDRFKQAKIRMGEESYYKVLGENGYEKSNQILPQDIPKLYLAMVEAYEASKIKPAKATTEEPEVPGVSTKEAAEALTKVNQESSTSLESLGFSTEEIEKEATLEFPPSTKTSSEAVDKPTQSEIMELTRLEATLVDKYEFTPDQILDQLNEMVNENDVSKMTKQQVRKGIEFFKETIEQLDKSKQA